MVPSFHLPLFPLRVFVVFDRALVFLRQPVFLMLPSCFNPFVFCFFVAVRAKSSKAFKYAPVGRLVPLSHLATVTCVAAIVSANFC